MLHIQVMSRVDKSWYIQVKYKKEKISKEIKIIYYIWHAIQCMHYIYIFSRHNKREF